MNPGAKPSDSARLHKAGYDAASHNEPVTEAQRRALASTDSQKRKVMKGWWDFFRDQFKQKYGI